MIVIDTQVLHTALYRIKHVLLNKVYNLALNKSKQSNHDYMIWVITLLLLSKSVSKQEQVKQSPAIKMWVLKSNKNVIYCIDCSEINLFL